MVLSCDCILAQVQSFQRVHCYTPNWIMGKTMATTECRSVTGAIKELTTVQKTTKNNNNNELTEAGRQQTHTGTSAVVRAHNNKNTLLYNLATTTRDMGKVTVQAGVGSDTGSGSTENSRVPFLPTYKVVFFIDTSAHNQLQC